jgi:hypothetical protein
MEGGLSPRLTLQFFRIGIIQPQGIRGGGLRQHHQHGDYTGNLYCDPSDHLRLRPVLATGTGSFSPSEEKVTATDAILRTFERPLPLAQRQFLTCTRVAHAYLSSVILLRTAGLLRLRVPRSLLFLDTV